MPNCTRFLPSGIAANLFLRPQGFGLLVASVAAWVGFIQVEKKAQAPDQKAVKERAQFVVQ
jgi:hypothetical protein